MSSSNTQPKAISIALDWSPLGESIAQLLEVSKQSKGGVQRFLDSLDSASQLVRIDGDVGSTAGAGNYRIVFQPSDLLLDFLDSSNTGGIAV